MTYEDLEAARLKHAEQEIAKEAQGKRKRGQRRQRET